MSVDYEQERKNRIQWLYEYADPFFQPMLERDLIHRIRDTILIHQKGKKLDSFLVDYTLDKPIPYQLRGFYISRLSYSFPPKYDCGHIAGRPYNRICDCAYEGTIPVFRKPKWKFEGDDR